MEKSHWLFFKNKCFVTHFSYSIFFLKITNAGSTGYFKTALTITAM